MCVWWFTMRCMLSIRWWMGMRCLSLRDFFSFPSSLSHRVLFGNPFYKWNDFKWQSRNAMIHFMMFLSHIYRFGAFFSIVQTGAFHRSLLLLSSFFSRLKAWCLLCSCACAAICLKHIFQRMDIFACKNTLLDDRCLFYLKLSGCFFFCFIQECFFLSLAQLHCSTHTLGSKYVCITCCIGFCVWIN